jgi:hypothetical protein
VSGFWDLKTRLWQRGRVSLWLEPRDIWLGYFHGKDASYLVILPMLPVRIERGPRGAEAH